MDALDEFRDRARAWLAEHAPAAGSGGLPARVDEPAYSEANRAWQATLASGGWACLTWPAQFGGVGASLAEARIFAEEQAAYPVTNVALGIGLEMVGPALIVHGSEAQRATLLPRIRDGRDVWCQLFSEPDAGSDLASLRTTAVRDGERWIVNGRKVWTSRAHVSDLGLMLARTEPDRPRHAGITAFVVPMRTPGIEIRPIRQIDGHADFNEVTFDGVELAADAVIGEPGGGWAVARTMLGSERAYIGTSLLEAEIDELIADVKALDDNARRAVLRDRLIALVIRRDVARALGERVIQAQTAGVPDGALASLLKLAVCRFFGDVADLAMEVAGPAGLIEGESARRMVLGQWATRIGGGTEQVQRNIIGERVLGLPREPLTSSGGGPRS